METVKMFLNGFRRRHHPTFFFNMFSVVGFLNGFLRGRERFFMVSVVVFVAGFHRRVRFLWFPFLPQHAGAEARSG